MAQSTTTESLAVSIANRIVDFFRGIPESVKEVNYWFYNISNLAYALIAILHATWIVVFFSFGVHEMMQFQFLSLASYIAAIVLNRKGYHMAGMIVALAETNLHQMFAVHQLGWDCGFQNFVPLISILPFLKYNRHLAVRLLFGLGCMCTYLFMDHFMKGERPAVVLTRGETDFFSFSNALLCFFLAGLWGIVLAISYKKTTNTLMLQKQRIEELVSEQEKVIALRTEELASANLRLSNKNQKLVDLIQYNAHNMREPLTRILGLVAIMEDLTIEEFYEEVWPHVGRAATDLDNSIRNVIKVADETIKE